MMVTVLSVNLENSLIVMDFVTKLFTQIDLFRLFISQFILLHFFSLKYTFLKNKNYKDVIIDCNFFNQLFY